MNRNLLATVFAVCALPSSLLAQSSTTILDEIVVSATKLPSQQSRIASSVTLIDQSDIVAAGSTKVGDVVGESPGVEVVQSGGTGGNSSVFIRGGNSEHVLVLFDGIEINNPINPTRAFNFANLSLNNIESIEVLRGPQSTLYGSDALAGVINIITKQGAGPAKLSANIEAGSFDSYLEQAGVSGSNQNTDYSLNVSREQSGGISSADSSLGNKERDGYLSTDFTGNVGQKYSNGTEVRALLRYADSVTDRDVNGGVGGDDPNNKIFNQDLFLRLQAKLNNAAGDIKNQLGFSYAQQNYQDYNYPDEVRPLDALDSKFFGKLLKADWRSTYQASKEATLLLGLETQEERGASTLHSESVFGPFDSNFEEQSLKTHSVYGQAIVSPINSFDMVLGSRLDHNEEFGSKATYRAGPVFRYDQLGSRVFGTVGTGFKAPSLYELYSEFGSKDLKPERSFAADIGIEQRLMANSLLLSLTGFSNRYKDLISFDPATFIFENIAQARSSGVEAQAQAKVASQLSLGTSFTFTNTKDEDTNQSLLRRARVRTGLFARLSPNDKLAVSARVDYVGRRADNNFDTFPATREILGGYVKTSLRASYAISDQLEVFVRGENIFDRNYQDVLGFGTPGAAVFAGLKLNL